MPLKGEMLPEEEEIRLEFLEMFQEGEVHPISFRREGGKRKIQKKREDKKEKDFIDYPEPASAAVARTFYDGRVWVDCGATIPLGDLSASVKTLPPLFL